MRKIKTLRLILGLNVVLGLVLITAGIITGKYGATVIGLIVAAVNAQQLISLKTKGDNADGDH